MPEIRGNANFKDILKSKDENIYDVMVDDSETGWVSGGVLAKTTPDSANVIISTDLVVRVVNRTTKTIQYETIPAGTVVPTGMAPNELKYVFVDLSTGSVVYKWIAAPTGADRRKYAQFGRAWMDGAGSVTGVGDYVDPAWDVGESFKETMYLSSICRVSEGNTYSLHGTNMTLAKTSGSDFRMAVYAKEYIAGTNPSPNEGAEPAVPEFASMIMMRRDLATLDHISAIPTTQYELNGVLTDLGNAKYGYLLVFHAVKSNLCLLQHGDAEYGSLQAAIDGFDSDKFTYSPVVKNACICKGIIAFQKGVSSPTSTDISFTPLNFVPGIGAGGGTGGAAPEHIDRVQIIYVGKHGNDTNSGLTPDKAKLTFGAAITYASSQTPASTNRFAYYCEDAGNYVESFTVPSWTGVIAISALVSGNIILSDDSALHVFRLTCSSGEALSKTTGAGAAVARIPRTILSSGANGVTCSSGTLTIEGGSIEVENGYAVGHVATAGVVYASITHIDIVGAGVGLVVSGSGKVRHTGTSITCGGSGTAYKAYQNGDIDSNCALVSCTTLFNMQSPTASIHVTGSHLAGATINPDGGTIRYSSVNSGLDISGDSIFRDKLNLPAVYAETTTEAGNVNVAGDGSVRRSTAAPPADTNIYNTNGTVGAGRAVGITDFLNFGAGNLYLNKAGNAVGVNTTTPFANGLTIDGGSPHLYWYDSATTENNRLWDFLAHLGSMRFRAVNDANTLAEEFMRVTRSGYAIGVVSIPKGTFEVPGVYSATTAEAPNINVASDGKIRRSTASAGSLYSADGTVGTGRVATVTDSLVFSGGGTTLLGTAKFQTVFKDASDRGVFTGFDSAGQIGVLGSYGSSGHLAFWSHNGTAWAEKMRLDKDGNLGISVVAPAYTLDVGGDVNTTGVYRVNGTAIDVSAPESWTAAPLNTNYSNATGYQASRYRLDIKRVLLEGMIRTTVAHGQGVAITMFTLPAGYRPLGKQAFMCHATIEGSPATSPVFCYVVVDTDGTVDILPIAGSLTVGQNWNISISAIQFAID